MCLSGHRVVLKTFKKFETKELYGLIVWIPILPSDTSLAALDHAFSDPRLIEGWDSDRRIGDAFKATLNLRRTAWDVYLVYGQDAIWNGENPPMPTFWMHQLSPLSGADPKLCLDERRFLRVVAEQLNNVSPAVQTHYENQ